MCVLVLQKKPSAEVQLEKLIQEAAAVSAPTSKGRNGKPPPPPPPPITSFTALSSKNDPKSSALLKYMKEMGEKRALKKKQARALKLAAKGDAAPKEKVSCWLHSIVVEECIPMN